TRLSEGRGIAPKAGLKAGFEGETHPREAGSRHIFGGPMRSFFLAVAAVIVVLAAIVLFRTFTLTPPARGSEEPATQVPGVAANDVAQHLAEAVRFQTVSYGAHAHEAEKNAELDKLRGWMETTYPNFHRVATREIIGKSLLFTWKGANPSLAPVLLMAHMDV